MSKPVPIESGVRHLSIKDYGEGYPGRRFQAIANDPKTHKPVTKKWDSFAECITWGTRKIAEFTLDVASGGQVLLKDCIEPFMETKAKLAPKSQEEIRRVLDGLVAAGCSDLKSDACEERAMAYFKKLKNGKPRIVYDADGKDTGERDDTMADWTKTRLIGHAIELGDWCMRKAIRKFRITRNPFYAINRPAAERVYKDILRFDECVTLASDKALALPEGLYWYYRLVAGGRHLEMAWTRADHILWSDERILIAEVDDFDRAEVERLNRLAPTMDRKGRHPMKTEGKRLKNGKRRSILPPDLAEMLSKLGREGREYLFSDEIRGRSNKCDIRAWKAHCRALGISTKITPHGLRRSCGSLLVASGLEMPLVLSTMGHSSERVNLMYTKHADLYSVQTKGWKAGEIALRQKCEKSVKPMSSNTPKEAQDAPTEDDLDCELFVILPDKSLIFEDLHAGQGSNLRPMASEAIAKGKPIATIATTFRASHLDDSDWAGVG